MRAGRPACVGAWVLWLLMCAAGVQAAGRVGLEQRLHAGSSRGPTRRLAQAATVLDLTATTTAGGTTPLTIAVNLGHRYPSSNWPLWMRRLGVNGARVFLTSLWGSSLLSFVGSTKWGLSLAGTPVTNVTTWQAAVAQLRTPNGHDPAKASTFSNAVKWSTIESKWATTVTSTKADEQEGNHNATLATLARLQLPPLVVIGCGVGSVANATVLDSRQASYWASHWELYKHTYAFTRYLWLAGVTRIELYNEPDLDNDFVNATDGSFLKDLWLDQYVTRSRAIQDVYADLNAENPTKPQLVPDVTVGAFAKTTYNSGKLGQPTVQAKHATFASAINPDPSWNNMRTYSYHSYGQSGKSILANFQELLTNTTQDQATYGSFSFAVTEFNAQTSGTFASMTTNMDTAANAIKLGSQAINYVTAGANLQHIYVFKFSVTLSSNNGVTKNGIHWGDNTAAPYNIADTTLGAEALRVVAEHLSGAKSIIALSSAAASSLTDTKAVAVRDGAAYWIYVVNTGTAVVNASLSLGAWGIGAGAPVTVERVNATHYGEVSELLTTGANGAVSTLVGVDNLVRLRVPASPSVLQVTIGPSAAAHVRGGASSGTPFNTSSVCVGTTTTSTQANTYASVMRFDVPASANLSSAVLRLTVSSLSAALTANMPMQLLAFTTTRANAWSSENATWTRLAGAAGPLTALPPAGAASTWKLDSVAKTPINWAAAGLAIAGHVTLPSGLSTAGAVGLQKHVDVTPFVQSVAAQGGGSVSFLLLRPFRNNKEVATADTIAADTLNAGAVACFWSRSATKAADNPRLFVQYG